MTISKAEIEKRAYELYLARGRADGKALNDWLDAKLDLLLERLEGEKTATRLPSAQFALAEFRPPK